MCKLVIAIFLSLVLTTNSTAAASFVANLNTQAVKQNNEFRNSVLHYVRKVAEHVVLSTPLPNPEILDKPWNSEFAHTYWATKVTIYYQGKKLGQGKANLASLSKTIQTATEQALSQISPTKIDAKGLARLKFHISFDYPPDRHYSFIEDKGRGLELLGDRVALRQLDAQLIKQRIHASQHYLLGVMHPEVHGFFKKYDASQDKRSNTLRTIYSASSLYTLLKLYHFNKDQQLEKNFRPIADFLLSMQITEGENAGGFYYAYNVDTHIKTCRLVVGTASKTIFTLIDLYSFYKDERYLNAAKQAGDWLITMVKPDGRVVTEAICERNHWQYNQHQSFLYSGQVLSALSRLYFVTKNPRYYENATKIAQRMVKEVNKQGAFVGDDFRAPNTISTSWVTMALVDYAKINKEQVYRDVIDKAATEILARQIYNLDDAYNHGRYLDTMTTSGNGWINEVLSELYHFCSSQGMANCKKYRDAIVLTSRWLLQNTYTEANSYDLKNPQHAIGGFMRNFISQTVRTDAVCHGLNSLINLIAILGPNNHQVLVTLPERPFNETIGLIRIGKGIT